MAALADEAKPQSQPLSFVWPEAPWWFEDGRKWR